MFLHARRTPRRAVWALLAMLALVAVTMVVMVLQLPDLDIVSNIAVPAFGRGSSVHPLKKRIATRLPDAVRAVTATNAALPNDRQSPAPPVITPPPLPSDATEAATVQQQQHDAQSEKTDSATLLQPEYEQFYALDTMPFVEEMIPDYRKRISAIPRRQDHSIFVSMAAYRDLDCRNTLFEMFTKCRHCRNVFVGLVDQMKEGTDEPCEPPPEYRSQVRLLRFDAMKARGPTMARYLASKFWRGEQFYMQIDGHLTFVDGWDERLLNMVPRIPVNKWIMSHYPVATVEELRPGNAVPFICNAKFDAYMKGLFSQDSGWYQITQHEDQPQGSPFLGAGFSFAPSEVLYDVPFDRYLDFLFHGEEYIYAARAWTQGYDFVVPLENVCSHVYGHRKNNAFVDHPASSQMAEDARHRVRYILGMTEDPPSRSEELQELGLGTERTLDEYNEWTGVSLAHQNISTRCDSVWDWKTRTWYHRDSPRPKGFASIETLTSLPFLNEKVKDFVTRTRQAQESIIPGTIFVSIVSYRDSLCEDTLNELFSKCQHCDRVIVGLVEQFTVGDRRCLGPEDRRHQIRVASVPAHKSEGPTFARYIASKLYMNEEYFLQLDSHLHFTSNWDVELEDMYQQLPTSKGVISTYSVIHTTDLEDPQMQVPWICHAAFDPLAKLTIQRANDWYNVHDTKLLPLNAVPGTSPFLGAGFMFARASFLLDAPYDRYLPFLFHGEELLVAARLWTSGWDFFIPTRNIVSHFYGTRAATVYQDKRESHRNKEISWNRVRYLLGTQTARPEMDAELEDLGLGTVRPIQDYWEFTGIDFEKQIVNDRCGQVYDYKNKVWLPNPR